MVSNSSLHYTIIKYIIDHGYAPSNDVLADILQASIKEIEMGLNKLQDYHGVVLHPNESKIWVIHPFSLSPTNFYVTSSNGEWWGNCAWCSLGVAALLKDDVTITTNLGGETDQIKIHIVDGEIVEKDYFIHFPIAMKNAWDNVIYTCSNMLIFKTEDDVRSWSKRHDIQVGDIVALEKIWQFSKEWYGNHLNPNWEKWSIDQARKIFQKYGLEHPIWALKQSEKRF